MGKLGTLLAKLEKASFPDLHALASDTPEAGIHFQDAILYSRKKDIGTLTGDWLSEVTSINPWFKGLVPNFKILPKEELPEGIDSGTRFTSVCVNTAIYLPWLVGQCVKQGVVVKRGVLKHILDAHRLHHTGRKADIVLNCTGLSSLGLGGVEDTKLYPGRGQTVIVRNEPGIMKTISGTDDAPDEAMYVMQRAVGGGTVLGGCLQAGKWESQPDPNLAMRIMKRCVALCPELTGGSGNVMDLDIIRHGVGLRPMREGGPRVEKEKMGEAWVVHCYGHGGYGYQSSWASARMVEELVEECRKERPKL